MLRLLAILFVGCSLLALCPSSGAQHYSFQYYGENDGLKNLDSHCLFQDKQGLIWVCTESGLFRFDGAEFQLVPLPKGPEAPYVAGLTQDSAGRIWIATEHGLFFHDSSGTHAVPSPDQEFQVDLYATLATAPDAPDTIYFIDRHRLKAAKLGSDRTWGVSPVFTKAELDSHPDLATITFVYARAHNDLWLGCGAGICNVKGGIVHRYGKEAGLPEEQWRRIFFDRSNRIWVRSEKNLFYLDPGSQSFAPAPRGLTGSLLEVRDPAIIEDPQGRLLVNLTSGLGRLDNNKWKIFQPRTELPPYSLSDLLVDRQGSLWIGMAGHGIGRWLGYNDWEGWNTSNGLSSETVWNFVRDQRKQFWVATEANLEKLRSDGNGFRVELTSSGNPLRRIQTLAVANNGHIWTGSDNGGVIDFDPETKHAQLVTSQTGIFELLKDHTGRIWICSLEGLFVADSEHPELGAQPVSDPQAPHGRVYQAVEDRDHTLWFSADSGLFRFAGGQWTQIALPHDYQSVISAQLAVAPDGTLWLSGSNPILLHIRVQGNTAQAIEKLDFAALHSNSIYFIAFDHRGWQWVGTGSGLEVFQGHRHKHLSKDDGLIWNEFDSDGFYEDTDGTIWLGTSGGISHLLHPERIFQTEPLELWVGAVELGNVTLNPSIPTRISWGRRPLTLHLSSLDFVREHAIAYRYRLEGLDEEWMQTSEHDIHFPPLPSGEYRLTVVAIDEMEGRQSAPIDFTFEILPPWWRSRWMQVAEITLGVGLLILIWHWSVRFLVAQKNRLESLVRQRTLELEKEKAELIKARAALEEQASHDPLTGLLNRTALFDQLAIELQRADREQTPLAVIIADLDHFKRINDTYGHITGDHVLKTYAERLQNVVRPYDFVGRYGGEEILLILPGLAQGDGLNRVEIMHRRAFAEPFLCNGYTLPITCSFGIAWYVSGRDTVESLIECADQALYMAKKNGRDRVEVYNSLLNGVSNR